MANNISDKVYWHKFTSFYDNFLPAEAKCIVEIGVFRGDSIRYWREKYRDAKILGLDILNQQPEWPQDQDISYFQLDQSDAVRYREILTRNNQPIDLLIEDGSHDPLHQRISLMESLDYLKNGSLYILEDIHTSHPKHPYYQQRARETDKEQGRMSPDINQYLMPLQCLLLIDHFKNNNVALESIENTFNPKNSLFSYEEIYKLFTKIKKINFYRRSVLPDYCYSCKTNNFDFINLRCSCGADLYAEADSMTAVIEF